MTCMGFHFVELFLHIIKSHNFNHTMFTSLPYSNQVLQVLELWLNAVCVCCCKLEYALLTKFIQIKAQSRLIHKKCLSCSWNLSFLGSLGYNNKNISSSDSNIVWKWLFSEIVDCTLTNDISLLQFSSIVCLKLKHNLFWSFKYVRFKRMCIVLLV